MSTTHIEIETVDQLRAAAPNLAGQVVQGVDLTGCSNLLRHCDVSTTIFLGCSTSARLAAWLRARGALIFPAIPGVPFDPYHPGAYTAEELYNDIGEGYHVTLDAAIDRWRRGLATPPRLRDTLATALHDDAMTDALDDLLAGTDPSMTVGGTGHLVTTWGGPGAMEATNLGAACPPDLLDESLDRLRKVAGTADVTTWVQAGLDVVSSWPQGAAHRTIGIPTWFYGHEPPNVFATSIIKYFSNALREDILLNRCRGGIIYLPGQAGTVQEIFQALTGNYYATSEDEMTPLIMLGNRYWSQTLPAWPLLHSMSRDHPHRIRLVDTVDEAVAALRRHPSR